MILVRTIVVTATGTVILSPSFRFTIRFTIRLTLGQRFILQSIEALAARLGNANRFFETVVKYLKTTGGLGHKDIGTQTLFLIVTLKTGIRSRIIKISGDQIDAGIRVHVEDFRGTKLGIFRGRAQPLGQLDNLAILPPFGIRIPGKGTAKIRHITISNTASIRGTRSPPREAPKIPRMAAR